MSEGEEFTLEEQLIIFDEFVDLACDLALLTFSKNGKFRENLKEVARQRFVFGYHTFGNSMFQMPMDKLLDNWAEEGADKIVYGAALLYRLGRGE